jgi:hypothetical protein
MPIEYDPVPHSFVTPVTPAVDRYYEIHRHNFGEAAGYYITEHRNVVLNWNEGGEQSYAIQRESHVIGRLAEWEDINAFGEAFLGGPLILEHPMGYGFFVGDPDAVYRAEVEVGEIQQVELHQDGPQQPVPLSPEALEEIHGEGSGGEAGQGMSSGFWGGFDIGFGGGGGGGGTVTVGDPVQITFEAE